MTGSYHAYEVAWAKRGREKKKNQLDVAAAAGTTCVKCGTDTTIRWLNCKDKPGTKMCKPCYDKNRSEKKKAASAKEK